MASKTFEKEQMWLNEEYEGGTIFIFMKEKLI